MKKFYTLPSLQYTYKALEPHISEQQLKIHHSKHHASYVKNTNSLLEQLDKNQIQDKKTFLKSLSFNLAGHLLHSFFWENLTPEKTQPSKELLEQIQKDFSSLENFKEFFSQTALSVEGSGWAVLSYNKETKRLIPIQIEKHNQNLFPTNNFLLVLDVWEHAYYLDYQNKRKEFIESFWNILNWKKISERFAQML